SFRKFMSVHIPNSLQELIGKRQVFAEVRRVGTRDFAADYTVAGDYEHFERAGATEGGKWIPFYGLFGGKILEVWVKNSLTIRVVDHDGREVYEKAYAEEYHPQVNAYQRLPSVTYLQADFLSGVANDVINAIQVPRSAPSSTESAASVIG